MTRAGTDVKSVHMYFHLYEDLHVKMMHFAFAASLADFSHLICTHDNHPLFV